MLNYKKDVYPYILNAIDFSEYEGKEPETDKEKLQMFFDTFNRQAVYEYNVKNFKTYHAILANHLSGLPSYINIPFKNWEILELAKKWGSIPENATEKQEDKILENYWDFMAAQIFKLFRKYNITMKFNA